MEDDVGFVYNMYMLKGFALDGRPDPGSQKFEFDWRRKNSVKRAASARTSL